MVHPIYSAYLSDTVIKGNVLLLSLVGFLIMSFVYVAFDWPSDEDLVESIASVLSLNFLFWIFLVLAVIGCFSKTLVERFRFISFAFRYVSISFLSLSLAKTALFLSLTISSSIYAMFDERLYKIALVNSLVLTGVLCVNLFGLFIIANARGEYDEHKKSLTRQGCGIIGVYIAFLIGYLFTMM